jgi:hypothetical protein
MLFFAPPGAGLQASRLDSMTDACLFERFSRSGARRAPVDDHASRALRFRARLEGVHREDRAGRQHRKAASFIVAAARSMSISSKAIGLADRQPSSSPAPRAAIRRATGTFEQHRFQLEGIANYGRPAAEARHARLFPEGVLRPRRRTKARTR